MRLRLSERHLGVLRLAGDTREEHRAELWLELELPVGISLLRGARLRASGRLESDALDDTLPAVGSVRYERGALRYELALGGGLHLEASKRGFDVDFLAALSTLAGILRDRDGREWASLVLRSDPRSELGPTLRGARLSR